MIQNNRQHQKEADTEKLISSDTSLNSKKKLKKNFYFKELEKLQVELVKMHEWVRSEGLKVVVIFEGRDAAGKGGVIKRIIQRLNPRVCRVVALGIPTEREKT
jgi:polyphosphate kinase 2 (PPK2 family)